MDRSAAAERGELAAGLENEREGVAVRAPPEAAHKEEEAEDGVKETEADVAADEVVPPEDSGGRGREALESGEGEGVSVEGCVGAYEVG